MKLAAPLGTWVGLAVAALALEASSTADAANAAAPADLVLQRGFIYTVDDRNSVQQAIAIQKGRIVYVGTNEGANAYIGKQTQVIDLRGRMVLPGFVDTHNHAIAGGAQLLDCDLSYAPLTIAQFQQKIQACLDATRAKEPDGYLTVVGWYRQAMQPSGTEVTKANLDTLKTRRPIIVRSTDGHTTLGNSRAMALAQITRKSPDPNAGRIDRDESGEPTGIFEDTGQGLISQPMPAPTAADTLKAAEAALDALRKDGQTAFMMQAPSKADIQAWSTLQKQGRLTARAYMAPDIEQDAVSKPELAVQRILDLQREFDTGPMEPRANLWVRNSGEIFQDGVLQWPAQTASMFQPYLVNKGTQQKPNWVPGPSSGPDPYIPLPQLKALLLALANAGIEPEVHAIGDRAVRHTLDAFAYVRQQLNGRDVRLQIAHAELVDPSDVPRFKELNVTADMGFQWAKPSFDSIDAAKDYLGAERFNRMEPEGYLNQAGVRIAQGSDWPVDPLSDWFAMKVLITREGTMGGQYSGPLGTVPGVPLKDAIRAFTINGAYALHSDQYFGSLEQGKLADLIVINQNLLQIPVSRIPDTKVLLTLLGGQTVFRDPSF
jgi:predicted amidohydrolase YtcJ